MHLLHERRAGAEELQPVLQPQLRAGLRLPRPGRRPTTPPFPPGEVVRTRGENSGWRETKKLLPGWTKTETDLPPPPGRGLRCPGVHGRAGRQCLPGGGQKINKNRPFWGAPSAPECLGRVPKHLWPCAQPLGGGVSCRVVCGWVSCRRGGGGVGGRVRVPWSAGASEHPQWGRPRLKNSALRHSTCVRVLKRKNGGMGKSTAKGQGVCARRMGTCVGCAPVASLQVSCLVSATWKRWGNRAAKSSSQKRQKCFK